MFQVSKLGPARDDFLDYLASEGASLGTIREYSRRLDEFLRWDQFSPSDLQTRDLRRYVRYLQTRPKHRGHGYRSQPQGTLSPASVHGHVATLKRFFRFLAEDDYITENPAKSLPFPRLPSPLPKTVSQDEMNMWLRPIRKSNNRHLRVYAVTLLLFDTGMRVSELCYLRMSDIEWEVGRLHVRGKGGKERWVPMAHRAKRALRRYISQVRDAIPAKSSSHVFLTETGRSMNPSAIQKQFRRWSKRTGVKITPHMLRHTFATQAHRRGMDLLVLQKALGHSDLEMVRHYAAVDDEDVRRAHSGGASPVESWSL